MLTEQDAERQVRDRLKSLAAILANVIQESPGTMVWIGSGMSAGPVG